MTPHFTIWRVVDPDAAAPARCETPDAVQSWFQQPGETIGEFEQRAIAEAKRSDHQALVMISGAGIEGALP